MTMLCFDSARWRVKFLMPCCSFEKPKVTLDTRLEKQYFMASLVIWRHRNKTDNTQLSFAWWFIIVECFVVNASLLPQIQKIDTHKHLSKKGVEKPNKLETSFPGLLRSLINSKEVLRMGLLKQDQWVTGLWLVFFLWLL